MSCPDLKHTGVIASPEMLINKSVLFKDLRYFADVIFSESIKNLTGIGITFDCIFNFR